VAEILISFNRFDEIADQLQPLADQVTRKVLFDIQAAYQRDCRRDTGAQAASAYVATDRENLYSQAASAARDINPSVQLLSDVGQQPAHQGVVAVSAAYAAVNEFGGHGRAGDGAMTRAAEAQREAYYAALGQLVEGSNG
jgi:hypothetical protein